MASPTGGRAQSSELAQEEVTYLVHHVFLPSKLPNGDDFDPKYGRILLDTTIDGLVQFKNCVENDQQHTVDSVVAMITNLRDSFNLDGSVSEGNLTRVLGHLCKNGGTLPLYIRAQNAGVMFTKVDDSIQVEAFELSPLNQSVVATKGRLRRSFPGPVVALNIDTFDNPEFLATVAHTLTKMSHQAAPETLPKVKKAGKLHDEDRDTRHPRIITELLMGFLRAVGRSMDVPHLWKNTREDVIWNDSLQPWRRSPLWLLVRVAIQLAFHRSGHLSKPGEELYKKFMVFSMSHILDLSCQRGLPRELLYSMNAKLARRLVKLGSSFNGPGLDFVQGVMQKTSAVIDAKWRDIMRGTKPEYNLSCLKSLDFDQHVYHTLPAVDDFIISIARRGNEVSSVDFQPESALARYHPEELPSLDSLTGDYAEYNLRAFEAWVASELRQWLEIHKRNTGTCGILGNLIRTYHSAASRRYSNNPEANSIMLITILELWIACDESATSLCDLLKDYDPGMPQELLQSLVLPFKSHMERLLRVEVYLTSRQTRARFQSRRIFLDFGHPSSFSVRYFSLSSEHKSLLQEIESQATQAKHKKCEELRQRKEEYASLERLVERSTCEYHEVVVNWYNDFREQRHRPSCKRCGYVSRMKSLGIDIYEWPLPSNNLEAQSTVFELKVPPSFGHWRDTTMFVLVDVLKAEYSSSKTPRNKYSLQGYRGLSSFFTPFSSTQCIGLLSENKPHEVTHRRVKIVSETTESDICLNNGLRYQYYDSEALCFVSQFCVTDEIPKVCTYQLPARSSSLQQFLFRSAEMPNGPSPNTVIARQCDCPDYMTLEEYKALCAIPLGIQIQWQNILLQLCSPIVDFKKVETSFVILQSIFQAGPSNGTVFRTGHESVEDRDLANAILNHLSTALSRLKENWESSQALSIFISLAARLLSLTSVEQITDGCLLYLRRVRAVALSWVNLLKDKAHQSTNHDERADLLSSVVELSLICIDSFNVDERYLESMLAASEAASVFIQCSIVIHEGDHALLNTSNPMIPILLQRWRCLSHRSYPILARGILEGKSRSLDDAIKKSWSAYQAGNDWKVVSEQANHWLVNKTAMQGNSDSLQVHFNLLTGELLVNGLPLARLPSKYERHATYRTLFGRSVLEVMPTAVRGMQFSGKKDYAGYTVHFGTNTITGTTEYDLLVQATKEDRKFELIPSRLLLGEFPAAFVDDYVHWYDFVDDCLEFRPIQDPWISSPDNWKLIKVKAGSAWHLVKDGMTLVYVKSETAQELSRILSPLADPLHIHPILHRHSSSLEIELPRIQLGFYLKSGTSSVQSRQFRGMVIDTDQSLGTLVGLCNKLMLKHENSRQRLVIVPGAHASYEKDEDHVRVTITKQFASKTHAYHVDDRIGRLVDNGSLQSKLFLCYLHALTSFCLPDPLTQRTGTEQALSILSSAAVRSFHKLGRENVDILCRIAQVTPGRTYYPLNKRVMQSIDWSSKLPFLSQHGGFYKGVKSIFAQAERAKILHPGSYIQFPSLQEVHPDLLERDCIRSSTFRVSGFGAEDHTVKYDVTYAGRDLNQNSEEGLKAFAMSNMVYHGHTTLHYELPSDLKLCLWNYISRTSTIFGPSHPLRFFDLQYDAKFLLETSSQFLSEHWCALHLKISQARSQFNKFRMMIWLSTLAFAKDADMNIVQTLASFFTIPEMAQIPAPRISSFNLSKGTTVNRPQLNELVRSALLPISCSPEAGLSPDPGELASRFQQRRKRQFQSNQDRAINKLIDAMAGQWPCETPIIQDGLDSSRTYINLEKALSCMRPHFKTWFENFRFSEYLEQIRHALSSRRVIPVEMSPCSMPSWNPPKRRRGFVNVDDVFSCSAPHVLIRGTRNLMDLVTSSSTADETTPYLTGLVQCLEAEADSNYGKNYVEDLQQSLLSLQHRAKIYSLQPERAELTNILLDHLRSCREHVDKTYEAILSAVNTVNGFGNSPSGKRDCSSAAAAAAAGVKQYPRLSPVFFLEQLTRSRWPKLSDDWKNCIIHYGVALTELQRAERLQSISGNDADLIKELQNPGHTNWNPFDYPESLLLEVESSIMIREVQEEIAREMRDPECGRNSVMQLNMGEGKSSVIVPIVATALADGSRLVRVIVSKPQSKQMFEMLVSKLGGLLRRRVYRMPFSRALRFGELEADTIGDICRECMENGGILLVQPEHILSFKLMALECLTSGKQQVGYSLLRRQEFFNRSSRDIVDESDENFSVKFELVYTMGMQRPVELSPDRWICIQQVLDLVRMFAPTVAKAFPLSMEVNEFSPGRFPRTRILRPDAQQDLFDRVGKHICEFGLNGFPIAIQPETVREAVFRYITKADLTEEEIDQVERPESGGFWEDATRSTLLLLRGLLARGLLAFAFGQKRWRVNYGLDATRQPRTRLAVPYRAKDNPAPRAEFSHTDAIIVLTSLSYYYGGLEDEDLFLTLSHVLISDQADEEYQTWVKDAPELPSAFCQLVGINLKDREQCVKHVFPPLRFAKSVIDYFLAHIVFPKEMKEFPHKLSASGWDIGEIKAHPTTGFSGTNDSRKTLPLSVEHVDLPEQKHTNALVLEHLLQPENSVALMPRRGVASCSDAELLLAMLTNMQPPVQVILDVGAQIIELSNLEVAKEWLKMMSDRDQVQAVVFFNESDELSVLDCKGHVEPFQISPFAKQLDVCLVFLDEAHTRGTDLNLPKYYQAAVTLGANLTKDRLVQACMRMRKLGKGQSVVFCVPEEIKTNILSRTSKTENAGIDVSDVLNWAISQTYIDLRRSMPLWATQGERFERQSALWAEARSGDEIIMSKGQAEKFLEDESQTLENRYRPRHGVDVTSIMEKSQNNNNIKLIMERCHEFDRLDFSSATLQEEQERELSPEIEAERQVERPEPAQPAPHCIHLDVLRFVTTGTLTMPSTAYMPAFKALHDTSAARHFDTSQFPCGLLVTADFAQTVQKSDGSFVSDVYQRPVQWILTRSENNAIQHTLIISPFEAEELLPKIKQSRNVALHLYAPRQNLGFPVLDRLDLYTIPARTGPPILLPREHIMQLNLFSGQLYLSSFKEYVEMCEFLGLAWQKTEDDCIVAADGFIIRNGRDHQAMSTSSAFTSSPVRFLKVLMTKIRRNCDTIDKTHMGRILGSRFLGCSDFDELDK